MYHHSVLSKALWLLSFLISTALLATFCTYPFAWPICAPFALLLAFLTLFNPSLGFAVFIATSLASLLIPMLMNYPYFSGAEPGFFGVWSAVSFRSLLSREKDLHLPVNLSIPLVAYVLAILASAFLTWCPIWELPDSWSFRLTLDALS